MRNLWVTTSGNDYPAYVCARDGLGLDRILLGSDFPFEKMNARPGTSPTG